MTLLTTTPQQLLTRGAKVVSATLSQHTHYIYSSSLATTPPHLHRWSPKLSCWVTFSEWSDRVRYREDLHTLIWFMGCGWMWAAWLLFTSHHVAASTLLTQHSAFSVVTARGLHTVHQSPSCRHLGHDVVIQWNLLLLSNWLFSSWTACYFHFTENFGIFQWCKWPIIMIFLINYSIGMEYTI